MQAREKRVQMQGSEMTEEKQMCGLECERGVVEGEKKSSRAWREGTEKEAE